LAHGIYSGVKKSGRKDLGLVFSEVPATVAAVFTTNQFKAAPVLVSMENARGGMVQAIIANSGNANCATGERGLKDARRMVKETAAALGIAPQTVLVTSTGSIGKPLNMHKIIPAIRVLARQLSPHGGGHAADAILTTDTFRKEIAFEVTPAEGRSKTSFRIAGIAKGSGMIHPNMATMHAFITTDARVPAALLKKMLRLAVDHSFNMITVDRETSTNDCVFVLANGLSGVEVKPGSDVAAFFARALHVVCRHLAMEIARDGEGATKLLEIKVAGASTVKSARKIARSVAGSDLVKAAIFGGDPNFGRVASAAGQCGVVFNPSKVSLKIQGVPLIKNGCGLPQNMKLAAPKLKEKTVVVELNLGEGREKAEAWGCDLSHDYVTINAKYHT
jgi:glutamate N-acetyltransferase/amino-acid N-acetyltransferase